MELDSSWQSLTGPISEATGRTHVTMIICKHFSASLQPLIGKIFTNFHTKASLADGLINIITSLLRKFADNYTR
jgi:hypothetical protein